MATVTITHSTVTGAAANLNVLVDGPKWDANHVVTGLENVDNTSDVNKPVSTAQAAALALKLTAANNLSDVASPSAARANLGILYPPQGRLTLTTATPVMQTSVAAATTVYYTPYAGNSVPIYDGTNMVPTAVAEVSQATTDTTKSPAACATNSNYDMFVWNDAGTLRCTRGPAWTSDTARGTGAGTTELLLVNGIYINKNAITNGPAASRGTYVGTIRTNGTSTVDYVFGTVAAGGGMASFNVWNAFNRVDVRTMVGESAVSWTYSVASTWRAANGSASARINMVRGLNEDGMQAEYMGIGAPGASTFMSNGVGLDSTTAFSGSIGFIGTGGVTSGTAAKYSGLPGLGAHYVSALEINSTTTASTWYGFSSGSFQSGLHASLRA